MTHDNRFANPVKTLYQAAIQLSSAPGVIAYLGNSVTVQKDGYRPRLHQALEKLFGHPHRAVNAGFGGVGSIASVCTMDDFVVRHRPDLCFIECMTGDVGVGLHSDTGPAVEGILRKLDAIDCAACFLNLPRKDTNFSSTNPLVALYSTIAQHYSVFSVNLARELQNDAPLLLKDKTHTTPEGAALIANLIIEKLIPVLDKFDTPEPIKPLLARDYKGAHITPITDAMIRDPLASETGKWRLAYSYREISPSNEVSFFSQNDELIGLLLVVGPHTGPTMIDGTRHDLRDRWCHYERLHAYVFDKHFSTGCTIRIAPLNETTDPPILMPKLKIVGFLVRPATSREPLSECGQHNKTHPGAE